MPRPQPCYCTAYDFPHKRGKRCDDMARLLAEWRTSELDPIRDDPDFFPEPPKDSPDAPTSRD